MPNLKSLLKSAQAGEQLVVTRAHAEWMEMPEDKQVYSEFALSMANSILRKEKKYERSGRYSPSSLGECQRRLMFGYLGAPQDGINIDSLDLMSMGTRDHFWWQLEGLTMGWMTDAEVWVQRPDLKLAGSMDGLLIDGSIFELKTVRGSIYNRIIRENEPKAQHLLQIHAYMLCSGADWASLVYQERDSGQYTEFRIPRQQQYEEQVLSLIADLEQHREADKLPLILDDCEMRLGYTYKQCPFRTHCIAECRAGR